MKKILLFATALICSCSSNEQEPNAYYDEFRHQVVIENCDDYTVKMSWSDKVTFVDLDVCIMPENKEIRLDASHTIEEIP
jgi:hypothetical protein